MDVCEIKRYKDNLLNNLKMRGEYDEVLGLRKKVLLVEGTTDQKFIERVKEKNVRCMAVSDFMRALNAFSSSSPGSSIQFSSKLVIISILDSIARYPQFVDFPRGAEKWLLYGLVDKDDDDISKYSVISKLFFTDTHDLETLMISSDEMLLTRLDECNITDEEVKIALYIANQLAVYRQALKCNRSFDTDLIRNADGTIDYDAFTDGDIVDLSKLLKHINGKADKPLSQQKVKRIKDDLIYYLRRKVDSKGIWKKTLDNLSVDADSDIWLDLNGHDILSAIRYINAKAKERFNNEKGHKMNRDFEIALLDAYNYECFKKTALYTNLRSAGLLKES